MTNPMITEPISCQVAVIGAGLAGLAATDYLVQKGIDAKLFEAQGFAGGRVFTRHTSSGQHYEEGAFTFTDAEVSLWKYIHRFSLDAVEQPPIDKQFYFRGEWGRFSDPDVQKKLSAIGLLLSYDAKKPDQSVAETFRQSSISETNIEWIQGNTLLGLIGDSLEDLSTEAAVHFLAQYKGSNSSYSLKGGNDRLPKALAKSLDGRIFYQFPIKNIQCGLDSLTLEGDKKVIAQRAILAIPLAAMRCLKILPSLSKEKIEAISSVPYTSSSRVTFLGPSGMMRDIGGGVFAISDTPSGWYRDQTLFQLKPDLGTVINLSSVGAEAKRMDQIKESRRVKEVIDGLKNFFSDLKEDNLTSHYYSWDSVEWVKGGYSYFLPGKFHYLKILAKREGRLHFAGEHTIEKFASMNGALESGIRAAEEVLDEINHTKE